MNDAEGVCQAERLGDFEGELHASSIGSCPSRRADREAILL